MAEDVTLLVTGGVLALAGAHVARTAAVKVRAAKKRIARLVPGHAAATTGRRASKSRAKGGGRR